MLRISSIPSIMNRHGALQGAARADEFAIAGFIGAAGIAAGTTAIKTITPKTITKH